MSATEVSGMSPGEKAAVQDFWGALYESAYIGDAELAREELLVALDELEDMFRLRSHGAVVEMPIAELHGKRVLEIGPGAGGHSALFARHGAQMTSVDITFARARATARKFELLGDLASGCGALQGDAERMPFADASFDIVYSNGVLHHTPDTDRAVREVYRVLKPGGRIAIMLYCKDSWHYWINMFLCVGILQGQAFRSRSWLGPATEWAGRHQQTVFNPVTRCYTRAGMRELFRDFSGVTLRKDEFYFYLIPKFGRLWRRWQIRRYGVHPGGRLVYGEPWPKISPLERWLGPRIGWVWYVSGTRPCSR